MGSPLSVIIAFAAGTIIAVAFAHPPLRRWLLQRIRGRAEAGRDELRRAVPEGADELFVAGWSFAGGAFVSILAANIGPIVSSEPWIQLAALAIAALVLIPGTMYFWWVRRRTLPLQHRWPFIVWSHYRPLMGRLASMVRPAGSIDFVTHRGADLPDRLAPGGLDDLSYGTCRPDVAVVVIVDVEAVPAITDSRFVATQMRLLPLDPLLGPDTAIREIRKGPLAEKLFPVGDETTEFLPLRWGFNTLAIRIADKRVADDIRGKYWDNDNRQTQAVDLFQFFTSSTHPLRARLVEHEPTCPLIAFDWYLPAMMLLVQSACGKSAWTGQNTNTYKDRMSQVLTHVKDWLLASRGVLEQRQHGLLFRDVVQMQDAIRSTTTCVILGGGNFLWSRDGRLTPANVVCIPVLADRAPYCLLWCEVLALLAREDQHASPSCRGDATRLLRTVRGMLPIAMAQMPFHGYAASQRSSSAEDSKIEEEWRTFALQAGDLRHSKSDTINHWRERWAELKLAACSESASGA